MRIISEFKDYYDSVQVYGQTSDSAYIRKTEEISCNKNFEKFYCYNFGSLLNSDQYLFGHVIGFCGKVYYCIEYQKRNYGDKKDESFCFYDFDSLNEFLSSILTKKQLDIYLNKSGLRYNGYQKDIKDFFGKIKQGNESYKELFFELKSPIFVRVQNYPFVKVENYPNTEYLFYKNSNLSKFEFYKVFPSYQAFQEISMFVEGVLGNPEKPIPQPSDDVMRDIKGFDKWSFRKPPTKI